MTKLTTSNAPASYASPVCKTIILGASRICQTSPYGEEGEAGGDGIYNNPSEDL